MEVIFPSDNYHENNLMLATGFNYRDETHNLIVLSCYKCDFVYIRIILKAQQMIVIYFKCKDQGRIQDFGKG